VKALLDTCVLYPTVMREVLLQSAGAGLFQPFWSTRILQEWSRAVAKAGIVQQAIVDGEIALLAANWPNAIIIPSPDLAARLYLPDANDIHVLVAGITGRCTIIITLNLRDFPDALLVEHQIRAVHPDAFLLDLFNTSPEEIIRSVALVHRRIELMSGEIWPLRRLLKKARLPRLGKALERSSFSS